MPVHDSRSSSKWNAIRSKSVPANVTTAVSDSSLLNQPGEKKKDQKRKDVTPARLHRSPGYFEASEPHSSNFKH